MYNSVLNVTEQRCGQDAEELSAKIMPNTSVMVPRQEIWLPAKVKNAKMKPRLLSRSCGALSGYAAAPVAIAASWNAAQIHSFKEREDTEDLILYLSLVKKEFDESLQLFWILLINLITKTIQN